MEKKKCVVQLPHPGGEHTMKKEELNEGMKLWSTLKYHRRKFLEAEGCVVLEDGTLKKDTLYFWGEWEPDSKVSPLQPQKPHEPHYRHIPILSHDRNAKGTSSSCGDNCGDNCGGQNTDPLVFGDSFLYSNCRQTKNRKQTQLANLCVGSLIVFGSVLHNEKKEAEFVVDTVFVVGDYKEFTSKTAREVLQGYVPEDYFTIMGYDSWKNDVPLTCYKGATPDAMCNDMYSFVPCRTGEQGKCGFERPVLNVDSYNDIAPNLFSKGLASNFKRTFDNKDLAKKVWDKLRADLHEKEFEEGVMMRYTKE